MKKIIYILPILLISLFSCSDFLDRDAENEVSNDELFSTVEGAEFALNGVYGTMTAKDYYGGNMLTVPEFKSGNIKFSREVSTAYEGQYEAAYGFNHVADDEDNSDTSQDMYSHLYELLNQVNNIISYLPDVETLNPDLKNQIMGEALALRALFHFDLCRLYAQPYAYSINGQNLGVATLLNPIDLFYEPYRLKLYETFEIIRKDLTDAMPLLSENSRGGSLKRATINLNIAKALMARVCLYMNDFETAEIYATDVIDNSGAQLVPNDDVLDAYSYNEPSLEDIWILSIPENRTSGVARVYGKSIRDGEVDTRIAVASQDLLDLFEEGDVRNNLFESFEINTKIDDKDTTIIEKVSLKFKNEDLNERFVSLIRLAEIYLIRAEARAELGNNIGARADLDEIRQRANPGVLPSTELGQFLVDKIILERRKEFCFEGHTYFDYLRKGKDIIREDYNGLPEGQNIMFPDNRMILPIPKHEIDYNGQMEQNPGYIG